MAASWGMAIKYVMEEFHGGTLLGEIVEGILLSAVSGIEGDAGVGLPEEVKDDFDDIRDEVTGIIRRRLRLIEQDLGSRGDLESLYEGVVEAYTFEDFETFEETFDE